MEEYLAIHISPVFNIETENGENFKKATCRFLMLNKDTQSHFGYM